MDWEPKGCYLFCTFMIFSDDDMAQKILGSPSGSEIDPKDFSSSSETEEDTDKHKVEVKRGKIINELWGTLSAGAYRLLLSDGT